MSAYAARSDALRSDAPPPAVERLQGAIDRVNQLIGSAAAEAWRIEQHDWDMRRLNQRLAPGQRPKGPMMPEFEGRYLDMIAIAKSLEAYRNILARQLSDQIAKGRYRR